MSDKLTMIHKHYASTEKPWMKYYEKELHNISAPRCTMIEQVRRRCEINNRLHSPALYYYGAVVTYKEFFEQVEQYAVAFSQIGVKKGDIVSFISVAVPETMCALYGLNKLGAACNLIDPRTDAQHAREYIKKAHSTVLITIEMCYAHVADALDELGLKYVIAQDPLASLPPVKRFVMQLKSPKYRVPYDGKRVIGIGDFFRSGEGKHVDDVEYEPDMPAIITRTGGTTGSSKGVVLSNDNMNALAANFFATIPVKTPPHLPNQAFLNFLPIASSYGIAVGVHMAMTMSIRDILIPRFELNDFDKYVIDFKPQHIIGVPVFYEKLIYSKRLKGVDLSFIDTMAAGGDSASESLEDKLDAFRIEHNIQYPVAQGYGMSEVSSAAAFGFRDVHRKGSVGVPCLFTTISVFEPGTNCELPIGEVGEICITGPTVMLGYLDEPEETANILRTHDDGKVWVHSGDLGYLDEDGFLYIVGRIKRAIVRPDAHKVYPLQIENVVMSHHGVANCSVIAVKDMDYSQGDQPLVCVELDATVSDRDAAAKEIMEICTKGLEERGRPVGVMFVDKIPVTDMAKNDYKKLQEKYYNYNYKGL